MTTKEAIADVNIIIKNLSVMSDTDMITDEGIKILKTLQHLIDIAKRFDGAVELKNPTAWLELPKHHNKYDFYAVPKENE